MGWGGGHVATGGVRSSWKKRAEANRGCWSHGEIHRPWLVLFSNPGNLLELSEVSAADRGAYRCKTQSFQLGKNTCPVRRAPEKLKPWFTRVELRPVWVQNTEYPKENLKPIPTWEINQNPTLYSHNGTRYTPYRRVAAFPWGMVPPQHVMKQIK